MESDGGDVAAIALTQGVCPAQAWHVALLAAVGSTARDRGRSLGASPS